MNPSLETLIERARAQSVPWNAERSRRVENDVIRRLRRSRLDTPLARLTVGGLASAVLFAALVSSSLALRDRTLPEEQPGDSSAPLEAPRPVGDASPAESPLGDGGFEE